MVRPCGGVQPGLERALTSGGENVLLAGSRSPLAEPQQAGLGEHGQFAVDLATGDPEERPESLISGGDQLATGHRARVQQSEQGGRRGVQVAHPPTVPRLPGTCPQWSTITVHCAFTRESRPWSNDPGGPMVVRYDPTAPTLFTVAARDRPHAGGRRPAGDARLRRLSRTRAASSHHARSAAPHLTSQKGTHRRAGRRSARLTSPGFYESSAKSRIRSMSLTRSAADPAMGVTFSVVTPEARSTSSRSRT